MKKTLLLVCFLLSVGLAYAQTKVVGTVTEQDGKTPMPFVTVSVKGQSTGVVATDVKGKYTINVGTSAKTLVFSFMGMKTEEVPINGRSIIDVSLISSSEDLDAAVVTAYGIKRDRKAINYSVQELKGDDLLKSKESNIVNSMAGRIAGVNITRSSGEVGASSQIVIRGGQSLTGNNQPLFIVDGIPIDNTAMNGSNLAGISSSRNMDEINRAADIDPEDIESINVLKGPAAAAQYGIDAAGGAVVITTKKGEKGEGRITYSNNFQWSKLIALPDVQTTYGAGYNGYKHRTLTSPNSWGPVIDEYSTRYDNINNFFQTGFTQKHSIDFSNSSEKDNIRLSGSYTDQGGIIPNSSYKTFNSSVSYSREIKKWIRISGRAQFTSSESNKSQKGATGFYRYLMEFPIDFDIRNWINPDGTQAKLWSAITIDNPFWSVYKTYQTSGTDRFLGNANITLTPFKGLTVVLMGGMDFYKTDGQVVWEPGTQISGKQLGAMSQYVNGMNSTTGNLRITYNREIAKGLVMDLTALGDIYDYSFKTNSIYGEKFQVPGFYDINNFDRADIQTNYTISQRRRVSAMGDIKLEYKGMIYLNGTLRQDWTSTLPTGDQGFSSPSASIGFIASELFSKELRKKINFFKLNAIWAQVGKDPAPYVTTTGLFKNDSYPSGGFYNSWTGGAPNLRAETTETWEVSLNTKFFNNRFGFDLTYYDMRSKDMILDPRVSYASKGFIIQYINGGVVTNKGWELALNVRPVVTSKFFWDLTINYSQNRGVLESLPSPLEYYYDSETWVAGNARVGAYPGQPFSTIQGYDYERDLSGKVVVDASTGYPVRKLQYVPVGNREPKFMVGIVNNFRILNDIQLSFVFDIRRGGDVYNGTAYRLINNGAHPLTEQRNKQIVVDGVNKILYTNNDQLAGTIPNGKKVGDVKEYVANATPVRMGQTFFESYYSNVETNFIEEVNWFRVRNISLSYDLPKKWMSKLDLNRVRLTFTADNVLLFTNYSGVEPEVNTLGSGRSGLGGSGIDYGSVPSSRAYSLGLTITF